LFRNQKAERSPCVRRAAAPVGLTSFPHSQFGPLAAFVPPCLMEPKRLNIRVAAIPASPFHGCIVTTAFARPAVPDHLEVTNLGCPGPFQALKRLARASPDNNESRHVTEPTPW
jgi:hypothetical protein